MKGRIRFLIAAVTVIVFVVLLNLFSIDAEDVSGDWYNDSGICLRLTEDKTWFCDGVFKDACGIWEVKVKFVILSDIAGKEYKAVLTEDEKGECIVLLGEAYRKGKISK